MYYPCSEYKGADQLRGYRKADLRLCFRKCRLLVFPWGGSNNSVYCIFSKYPFITTLYCGNVERVILHKIVFLIGKKHVLAIENIQFTFHLVILAIQKTFLLFLCIKMVVRDCS